MLRCTLFFPVTARCRPRCEEIWRHSPRRSPLLGNTRRKTSSGGWPLSTSFADGPAVSWRGALECHPSVAARLFPSGESTQCGSATLTTSGRRRTVQWSQQTAEKHPAGETAYPRTPSLAGQAVSPAGDFQSKTHIAKRTALSAAARYAETRRTSAATPGSGWDW